MCFYICTHEKACEGFGPTLSGHVENYTVLIWFLILLQNVAYSIYLPFFFPKVKVILVKMMFPISAAPG